MSTVTPETCGITDESCRGGDSDVLAPIDTKFRHFKTGTLTLLPYVELLVTLIVPVLKMFFVFAVFVGRK